VKLKAEGLYAIVDVSAWHARGIELLDDGVAESIASALLRGGASALQLRAKHAGGRDTLTLLRRLVPIAAQHDVPLFANDRADLALLASTTGVHLGQDDLPLAEVRRIAPALLIGVSTHNEAQLREAIATRPDYVAFGPVFGTTSKERPDPTVGSEGVKLAASIAGDIPLVVIGGITRGSRAEVIAAGARWVAVISDLVVVRDGAPDLAEVEARARAFA
jgi:thiamine-phosphate pyrophosphorylase